MSKPSSTATIRITLANKQGWVTTPVPTAEHGGIHPVPRGVLVELNVGDAHHLPGHTAHQLAGALAAAMHVDVVGTDYRVQDIKAALDLALQVLNPTTEGTDPWGTEEAGQ